MRTRRLKASGLSARHLTARRISAGYPVDLPRVTYIGDSTTQPGYKSRWSGIGCLLRSDAESIVAGTGSLMLYDDSTVTWAAPGDTPGPRTAAGFGFVWLESGSADKGVCINVPSWWITYAGTPEGTEMPIDVEAAQFIGNGCTAPCVYAQTLSGHRLTLQANLGVDGETTQKLLQRIEQVFNTDSLGRSTIAEADVIGVLIGINDIMYLSDPAHTDYTIDDVKGWLTDIKNAITSRGKIAMFGNLSSESPSGVGLALMIEINDHLNAMALSDSRVRVADFFTACAGAGMYDGLHFMNLGAKTAGALWADILTEIGGGMGRSAFRRGGRSGNLAINGKLEGDSGNVGGGITGVCAIDALLTGVGAVVGSKEPVADENDWQVFTITGAEEGDVLYMFTGFTGAVAGDHVSGEFEYQITGAGVKNMTCALSLTDNDALLETVYSDFPQTAADEGASSGVAKTIAFKLPAWFQVGSILAGATLSAGDTVIKYRDLGVGLQNI